MENNENKCEWDTFEEVEIDVNWWDSFEDEIFYFSCWWIRFEIIPFKEDREGNTKNKIIHN